MRPMIDDLELPQVQQIDTSDGRRLAEHRAPGQDGSVLQDLGRRSTRIVLYGVATGPDSVGFVEKLDGKFRAGDPVPFAADIVADAEIDQVFIDDLRFEELAGKPERYAYLLTLQEHQEPVAPAVTPGLDAGILDDATQLVDEIADGLAALPGLVTGLEPFAGTLGDFLARLREFGNRIEQDQP
jgi:DNA circularisation protein N-terminus